MITRKNSRCGTAPRISVQGWLTHTRRHWEYQLLMAHNSLSMETAVSNFPRGQQRSPHTPAFLSTFQMFLQRIFPNRPFIHSLLLWLSVAKSCLTVCDPIDCGTPGLPVLHYLPELLKLMSTKSKMLSNHLILNHFLLLLPSIFPSTRIFSSESALHIRWPKYIGASASALLTQSLFPGNSSWYK